MLNRIYLILISGQFLVAQYQNRRRPGVSLLLTRLYVTIKLLKFCLVVSLNTPAILILRETAETRSSFRAIFSSTTRKSCDSTASISTTCWPSKAGTMYVTAGRIQRPGTSKSLPYAKISDRKQMSVILICLSDNLTATPSHYSDSMYTSEFASIRPSSFCKQVRKMLLWWNWITPMNALRLEATVGGRKVLDFA